MNHQKNILIRLIIFFKKNGPYETILLAISYPFDQEKERRFKKKVLTLPSEVDRFVEIYRNNYWGNSESVSGSGSTIEYTYNLRVGLKELFLEFHIKSLLDAPCGDFNWMKDVLQLSDIKYIGGDIVSELIAENNLRYHSANISFVELNILRDVLPYSDLLICRDCLFHFSEKDIRVFFSNFVSSGIPYLLTTNHINSNLQFKNSDIITGDYRLLDLFSSPYSLPKNPLFRILDWIEPHPQREMCLWSREQILASYNS